ncbi:MAG: glycosyl hydrolase family 32 [Rhodoluna sp.]
MGLKLAGQWVWDSWFVRDGQTTHAFYLQASRALGDPNRRHRNVTVGHAISTDLTNWTVVQDAIAPSEPEAFDSWTTWTGSIVRQGSTWYMFYTGTSREDAGAVQSVGLATSPDLYSWTKHSTEALVRADAAHYSKLNLAKWHDEAFRDPWVFKFHQDDPTWHMLVTSRGDSSTPLFGGVMGHATSIDLLNWQCQPPLSQPGQGFGETEVFQFEVVDGVPIVLFCCSNVWVSQERKDAGEGGVYSLPVAADLGDVDFNRAVWFDSRPDLYASRLVQGNDGRWNLIGFINIVAGEFVGELSDPIPVTADPQKGLIPR